MNKLRPFSTLNKSVFICLLALTISACGKKNNIVATSSQGHVDFYNACIVWNGDDRKPIANSERFDKNSGKSVALMMPNWAIAPYDHYKARIKTENLKTVEELINLCDGEKYASEYSYGQCSGFLVDKDIMVSAGHCFIGTSIDIHQACSNFSWVFDLDKKSEFIEEENIYKCQKILTHSINEETGEDFIIFKLDRNVKGRSPLQIDYNYVPNKFTDISIIGHPLGMRKMIAKDKGTIQLDFKDKLNFYYLLDTFPSNSGSPIINQNNGKVIGIHVAGDRNYLTKDETKGCYRYTNCIGGLNSGNCALSRGITLSTLKNYISQAKSCQ